METMNNSDENKDVKQQLFDFQFVCEITVASIILFLTEAGYEKSEDVDENRVADFVLKRFLEIVESITDDAKTNEYEDT